jgi:hypothetical protein
MLFRSIQIELLGWYERDHRKPLVLRGARQVGKTTVVNQHTKHFKNYIYLNLEKEVDKSFSKIILMSMSLSRLYISLEESLKIRERFFS